MTAGSIVGLILFALVVVVFAVSWFRRHEAFDLGTVSHQWIAEQRFGPGNESRR